MIPETNAPIDRTTATVAGNRFAVVYSPFQSR
jgi:hypothetical protein